MACLAGSQAALARQEVTAEVQQKRYPGKRIMTEIVPEQTWWDAEEYHQKCARLARSRVPYNSLSSCAHVCLAEAVV